MEIQVLRTKVINIIDEAPEIKTFQIECPLNFNFQPGQFVMLSLPARPGLSKAYSIASSPKKQGIIDLTIKIETYSEEELDKHLTPKLDKISKGQEVIIKGPYGKFVLDETYDRITFLSAGTGIAPLMSMIRYCIDKKLNKNITLINSNRTPEHIIYKDELKNIKDKIKLIQTITRPEESNGWNGIIGRISKELIKKHIHNDSIFYICGPNDMVRQSKAILEELNIPKENIKVEFW